MGARRLCSGIPQPEGALAPSGTEWAGGLWEVWRSGALGMPEERPTRPTAPS